MKKFRKVYVEITNVCNLNCFFCHGTKRPPRFMTLEDFSYILREISPYTRFVYLHLMGEPLLHPQLEEFIEAAAEAGIKVCITTNGTLLRESGETLSRLSGNIHKISISLQAAEANPGLSFDEYMDSCLSFGRSMEGKAVIVYRLWNEGGADTLNGIITGKLKEAFPGDWEEHPLGRRIGRSVYLEFGKTFIWPDPDADIAGGEDRDYFCYGLRDHIGILSDGTVVPCCLDSDGNLALGNIVNTPLSEILECPRANAISEGFSAGRAAEDMCRRCDFATRFV